MREREIHQKTIENEVKIRPKIYNKSIQISYSKKRCPNDGKRRQNGATRGPKIMKNTKNDMPKMRSNFSVAKKSKKIETNPTKSVTRSTPGDERVDFWTVRGERGEDSSPFRLTSSLILHALHPGGLRRMKIDQKSSLGRPGCDCDSFLVDFGPW